MKLTELNSLFNQYTERIGINQATSKFVDGEYIPAPTDTYSLQPSDVRIGKKFGIMKNEEGSQSLIYGFVSMERMAGFLDAAIHNTHPSKQNKTTGKYYSIRVVTAENEDEATEKIEDGDFDESDGMCDIIVTASVAAEHFNTLTGSVATNKNISIVMALVPIGSGLDRDDAEFNENRLFENKEEISNLYPQCTVMTLDDFTQACNDGDINLDSCWITYFRIRTSG